jgi:hypothetical protein
MEGIWTYRDETIGDIDLAGYSVEAVDGSVGKVDAATYDVGSSFLVVDTGPWIFGKKVLLPAGVVDRIDTLSETVFLNRSREEIKGAPEFDFETEVEEDDRARVGEYYAGGVREPRL